MDVVVVVVFLSVGAIKMLCEQTIETETTEIPVTNRYTVYVISHNKHFENEKKNNTETNRMHGILTRRNLLLFVFSFCSVYEHFFPSLTAVYL